METLSFWKKSVYSTLVFFGTLIILSIGYALVGNLSTADKVATGSGLSSASWNRIVDGVLDLNTRLSNLSFSGGNVGIGTAAPDTRLDINGEMIRTVFYYEPGTVWNITFPANTWSTLGNGWNFTYTKKSATSKLLITLNTVARWNYTATSGWGQIGFNINGTNYDFWGNFTTTTDMHTPWMYRRAISNIPKGVVTIQGIVNQANANWVCIGCAGIPNITIEEIY